MKSMGCGGGSVHSFEQGPALLDEQGLADIVACLTEIFPHMVRIVSPMNRVPLMPATLPPALPEREPSGHFVQTDRAAHEAWMQLTLQAPKASAVLHLLANRVGEHNAVVASYPTLAEISGLSVSTIRRAIAALVEGNWIEVRRLGPSSTVNAYVLNDRVVWTRARNDLRYSLFSATVITSETEQEDREALGRQERLRQLPRLGEQQMPSGSGLPPVSQPFLSGMEPALPATGSPDRREEEV